MKKILLFLVISLNIQAQLYEGFNYTTNGVSLNGLNGGTGWGTAWNNQGGGSAYVISTTGLLNYGIIPTTGNYVIGGTAWLSTGRGIDLSSSSLLSPYLTTISGSTYVGSGTFYLSALFRDNQPTSEWGFMTNNGNGGNEWLGWNLGGSMTIGQINPYSNCGSNKCFTLRIGQTDVSPSQFYTSTKTINGDNISNFIIVKYDFGPVNSTITSWVNPTCISDSYTFQVVTTTSVLAFKNISIYRESSNKISFDEIKITNYFPCLTPLPINLFYFVSTKYNSVIKIDFDLEKFNEKVVLQKSSDLNNWKDLKIFYNIKGYNSYMDEEIELDNYYRLKSINNNYIEYSNIIYEKNDYKIINPISNKSDLKIHDYIIYNEFGMEVNDFLTPGLYIIYYKNKYHKIIKY